MAISSSTWKGIIRILALVLGPLLKIISPMIKDALTEALQGLYLKAVATSNPVDDLFAEMLLDLLGIEKPKSSVAQE